MPSILAKTEVDHKWVYCYLLGFFAPAAAKVHRCLRAGSRVLVGIITYASQARPRCSHCLSLSRKH
eukprot:scaffold157858_cov27-Prasinocladus_malaysianus.AAC.1